MYLLVEGEVEVTCRRPEGFGHDMIGRIQPGELFGLVALIVTTAGAITPLILFTMVKDTPFQFLFKRPAWAKLEPARLTRKPELQTASQKLVAAE